MVIIGYWLSTSYQWVSMVIGYQQVVNSYQWLLMVINQLLMVVNGY